MHLRNLIVVIFVAALFSSLAVAAPEDFDANGKPKRGPLYDPRDYGSCTWDATHDVGPCVNAAITAAGAAGGGEVRVPAGTFGVSTQIQDKVSGVHLRGAGVGMPYNTPDTLAFTAATRFKWLGAGGATMFDLEPAGAQTLYSMDVIGITFDCNLLANVCAKFQQVSNSVFSVGGMNARINDLLFTTSPGGGGDPPGFQENDVSAWVWDSQNNTYKPTGILFDSGAGSWYNVSNNVLRILWANHGDGDGIVFGNSDSNSILQMSSQQQPGTGSTEGRGQAVVFANSAYVMPNGNAVTSAAGYEQVVNADTAIFVAGYQSGATVTAGVHVGTAAVNPIVTTATGAVTEYGQVIAIADVTKIVPGMTARMTTSDLHGGHGLQLNDPVIAVTGSNVTFGTGVWEALSNGISLTFTYGISAMAVPGTYTVTAVDATHWSLTAPAGGHSQTNIAVVKSAISFVDLTIPLTGTPSAGDTFVVVVPTPATQIVVDRLSNNNARLIMAENGASVLFTTKANGYPVPLGSGYFPAGVIGNWGNASGRQNGVPNVLPPVSCQGNFNGSIVMTPEACTYTLRGLPGTSTINLTTDSGANNGVNCVSVPLNTAYSFQAVLTALDQTSVPKNWTASWGYSVAPHLLTGGPTLSATLIDGAATAVAFDLARANGTVTGINATVTADQVNGCITMTFTPPSGNTDTWSVSARVLIVKTP